MRWTDAHRVRRSARPALAGLAAVLTVSGARAQQTQAAPPASTPRNVIVLDAAHGGDDAGAHLDNASEKDVTLALSVKLRSLLTARGFSVITTRESDTGIDSLHRAEIADKADAQACLSLHATQAGSGVHLFASSLSPAAPARIPAWKTAQAGYVTRSLALAGVLNSTLQHAGLPVTIGRTALPGVDSMTCPAVAVEIAPLHQAGAPVTSPADSAYQTQLAESLAAALLEWKSEAHQP